MDYHLCVLVAGHMGVLFNFYRQIRHRGMGVFTPHPGVAPGVIVSCVVGSMLLCTGYQQIDRMDAATAGFNDDFSYELPHDGNHGALLRRTRLPADVYFTRPTTRDPDCHLAYMRDLSPGTRATVEYLP